MVHQECVSESLMKYWTFMTFKVIKSTVDKSHRSSSFVELEHRWQSICWLYDVKTENYDVRQRSAVFSVLIPQFSLWPKIHLLECRPPPLYSIQYLYWKGERKRAWSQKNWRILLEQLTSFASSFNLPNNFPLCQYWARKTHCDCAWVPVGLDWLCAFWYFTVRLFVLSTIITDCDAYKQSKLT